jgi:hypothetical protein
MQKIDPTIVNLDRSVSQSSLNLPIQHLAIEWSISTCFQDWLTARGGDGSIKIKQACEQGISNPLSEPSCASCGLKFISEERVHLHHADGNHDNWKQNNLVAIHESCHDYLHMSKSAS